MLFLYFINTNLVIADYKPTLSFNIATKTQMTTQHIKIIDRKKFTRVELNKYSDMFLVYIVFFSILLIYLILKT